jgi:Na+/proline symporter
MFIICLILLACFGAFGGMYIGAGNRAGLIGAIVCGAVTGLLLNIPFLPDGDRLSNVVLFTGAVAGAIIVNYMDECNWLKRRLLDQKKLRINLGKYYRIGCDN